MPLSGTRIQKDLEMTRDVSKVAIDVSDITMGVADVTAHVSDAFELNFRKRKAIWALSSIFEWAMKPHAY